LIAASIAQNGPENAPSKPNTSAGVGEVTFIWTASGVSFPGGYDFRYHIDGSGWTTVAQATSPVVVSADPDSVVCGELRGHKGGFPSDWCPLSCATATAVAAAKTTKAKPKTKTKTK